MTILATCLGSFVMVGEGCYFLGGGGGGKEG